MHLKNSMLIFTSKVSLSYPAHIKLHMRLAWPADRRLARVSQNPRGIDWFLAVSLRTPLSTHQAPWTTMTSSNVLLLVSEPHLWWST